MSGLAWGILYMKNKGGIFLALFGSVFLAVGLGMGFFAIKSMDEAESMLHWKECQAVLTSCELSSHRGSKGGTTYSIKAHYTYSMDGVEYAGDRVSLYSSADNIGSFHQDQYRRLKQAKTTGTTVSCWVNPENPAESILVRKPRPPLMVFKMLFVLVFGSVGLGIGLSGLLAVLTPDTSSEDFVQTRIRMRNVGAHKVALAVAGLWNLFSLWMLWKSIIVLSPAGIPMYLWAAFLSGIAPAIVALYLVLRINKYGVSYFEMSPVPGVLGGPVSGNIRIPRTVQANEGFELELQCIHQYTTRSGKNSQTHKDVMWDSRFITDTVYNYGSEVVLPVNFKVPYNQPATSVAGNRNGFYWQLKAKAETAGIDYAAVFDVPVKFTSQSREEYADEGESIESVAGNGLTFEQFVVSLRLGYKWLNDDSFAIDFPACRVPSAAIFLGVFVAIWTGACFLMWGKAPIFFASIFIVIDLFLVRLFLSHVFVSVRMAVNTRNRVLKIYKSFAGILYKSGSISFSEVDNFACDRGMQSGSTTYYRVVVNLIGGKKVKVGGAVNSRSSAKRISDELNKIMDESNRASKLKGSLEDLYASER